MRESEGHTLSESEVEALAQQVTKVIPSGHRSLVLLWNKQRINAILEGGKVPEVLVWRIRELAELADTLLDHRPA